MPGESLSTEVTEVFMSINAHVVVVHIPTVNFSFSKKRSLLVGNRASPNIVVSLHEVLK